MNNLFFIRSYSDFCDLTARKIESFYKENKKNLNCVVQSSFLFDVLSSKFKEMGCESINMINTYNIDNSITGDVAFGAKVVGSKIRKIIVKNILEDMNIGIGVINSSFVNEMCDLIDLFDNNQINQKLNNFFSSKNMQIAFEFIEKWKNFLKEKNLIDIAHYNNFKIEQLIKMCDKETFVAINLSPRSLLINRFIIRILETNGVVIFGGADCFFDNSFFNYSGEQFYCHKELFNTIGLKLDSIKFIE